jgi:cytochrome c-type biogenesis protein CcmH/NrfF
LVNFYTVGKPPINWWDWLLCVLGLLIALLFTWLTYGNHPQFKDKPLMEERSKKYNELKKSINEQDLID